ncbi:MAG: dethiobiotin synthase [Gallionellales bacterium GWA2_60_18]|nr:MAG: dethiobiotin synthase [Gallionellales bacterium GWA2_60_18]
MSYFITGTDTGVGKTLVSCALLQAFAARGKHVVGMKPVAAGCGEDEQHEDVRHLRAAGNVQAARGQINQYCFQRAVAPHLAAQFVGVAIDFGRIATSLAELESVADVVIVEGAGGFRVPLNTKQDSADLQVELGLPIILVVGMRLGCLNHALLTVEAIMARGLTLAGWVANRVDADMAMPQENIAALRQRIAAPLLGVIPYLAQPDAGAAAVHLDVGLLASERDKSEVSGDLAE